MTYPQMTDLDRMLEARAAELERWLESPDAWPLLVAVAKVALIVALFVIAVRWLAGFTRWATESWRRLVASPVVIVVVVFLIWFAARVAFAVTGWPWLGAALGIARWAGGAS